MFPPHFRARNSRGGSLGNAPWGVQPRQVANRQLAQPVPQRPAQKRLQKRPRLSSATFAPLGTGSCKRAAITVPQPIIEAVPPLTARLPTSPRSRSSRAAQARALAAPQELHMGRKSSAGNGEQLGQSNSARENKRRHSKRLFVAVRFVRPATHPPSSARAVPPVPAESISVPPASQPGPRGAVGPSPVLWCKLKPAGRTAARALSPAAVAGRPGRHSMKSASAQRPL